jgi:Uma2 family endonuclease
MLQQVMRRMMEEEFLAWQIGQADRHELVDGQPRAMTGANFGHDQVLVNAMTATHRALRAAGSRYEPVTKNIAVRVPAGNLRRPDVAVYCPPFDLDAMVSNRPRLVIEVLSESTQDTDHVVKLEEYKEIKALDYIILIAPRVVDALVWSRQPDRSWKSHRYQSLKDFIPLPSLEITLSLAELYERVELLPPRPKLVSEVSELT